MSAKKPIVIAHAFGQNRNIQNVEMKSAIDRRIQEKSHTREYSDKVGVFSLLQLTKEIANAPVSKTIAAIKRMSFIY